jgi:hypothetical protein
MTETITMTFAALAVLWHTPTDDAMVTGIATYNNRMATVAVNRGHIEDPLFYQDWLDAEGLAGAVALNRQADIGRKVWIDGPAGREGPFLVIDCAQLRHLRRRLELGRLVDVDHITGERWGMFQPIPVDVYFQLPEFWDHHGSAGAGDVIPIPL